MASTFLDEKISSFIEDKFPEFVKADHPVFVDFLRLYYQFMEASKITLTDVLGSDQILLENKLTTNYLANEFDDTRFVYEDSTYGAFIKDETVTGQTSGAVSTILSENNSEGYLYIETNRHFQVGEIITGGTSAARATISKYQGNPVQNIQQLLEYVNVDKTISDFLDQFRNTYLTAIPNTLASGVSKRKLIKSVRDLYRAKGTRKGHELFFRLMFDETPELTYPTENILKISAGDWSSDTVLRVVATENNPANLVGQTVTQTVNVGLDHGVATANVESILQLQEGETTVYQLILNVASIEGTFISGAEVTGIDNTDADTPISATVQPVLIGADVTEGAAGYTTNDTVTISSATGQNALISIVDVGSGAVGQIVIDNPGSNYSVGDPLFFDNTNTEGAGASAIVSCIGGAIAPELGDTTLHTITGTTQASSTSITNITTSTLYADHQFVTKGKLTTGSTSVTDINTVGLVVGATISGTGIPANTTISSIDTKGINGSITISNAAVHGGTTGSITSITRASTGALDYQLVLESGSTTEYSLSAGDHFLIAEDNDSMVTEDYLIDTATVVTASAHGLTTGDTVTIIGATPIEYTALKTIVVTSTTGFTYDVDAGISTPAGGTKTFTVGTIQRTLTHLEEGTGQKLTGNGIPIGATIRSIDTVGTNNNGTISISSVATISASGVGIEIPSQYGMETFDHIVFDEGTETTDAYTGNQIEMETATFADLSVTGEAGEVVNVTVFNPGSGYELMPTITPATSKLTFNSGALTTSGEFSTGETISNDASPAVTATIVTSIRGSFTISKATGAFAAGQVITGNQSNAKATLTVVTALGANATFLGWTQSGIGSITGVEVSNFGTGFDTAPSASVPIKMLLTRKIISDVLQADITLATAFSVGDTIIGQTSSARGVVTAWDNTRQTLTVRTTLGTFQRAETLTRGAGVNYAVVSEIAQGALSTTVGTVGTTAGAFNNDKGKISESLMKIQDSFYYQDFSYVVKVGAAIKDWRAEIKKSVHPAGFAMFGEVSITNKVATLMTTPITGVTTETPTLASLFEAVITTVIGRRLGTLSDGTTLLGSTEIKGTTDHVAGTLKRGSHLGHEPQLFSTVESITRSGTTATVETTGPHGAEAGEQVEISGVTTTGYDGIYEVLSKTDDKFTITVSGSLATPATVGIGKVKLISPFDNSTRDVTARPHTEVTVYPLYGEWNSNQRSRYGLGPRQSNAAKYMWATSPTEYEGSLSDTLTNHQTLLESSTATNDDFLILEPEVLSDVDFTVTVAGGKFVVDSISQNALEIDGARHYRFDLSDSSVSGHPFKLSETSDGVHSSDNLPRVDYTVTVATGTNLAGSSGNVYVIAGLGSRPTVSLQGARTYRFDLSNSSLSGHPLKFSTTSNGTHNSGTEYTTGVTTVGSPGSSGAYVEILTQNSNLSLHYYCGNHANMGNSVSVTSRTVTSNEYDELSPDPIEFQIELESGSYTEYTLLTDTRWNLITEDSNNLAVQTFSRVGNGEYVFDSTTYGTPGSFGAYVDIFTENRILELYYYCHNHSGMGSSLSITPRSGGNIINEAFQLGGPGAVTNIVLEDGGYILYETDTDSEDQSVMVSEESTITYSSVTEDSPTRIQNPYYSYVYPNITRRESPETGTDNVDAGGAGVYDATMTYTNIQIGAHESNVHNRISDFANVRIVDIIKSGREFLEIGSQTNKHEGDNDYEFTIMEDGSYVQMESGAAGLPAIASKKIWNVPPPSYIRLTTT